MNKVVAQEQKNVKHFQYRGYARDIRAMRKDKVKRRIFEKSGLKFS